MVDLLSEIYEVYAKMAVEMKITMWNGTMEQYVFYNILIMDSLKLTEQEQRNYAELFSVCDLENTGKVTGVKAFDLFLTSGLTQDVLHKVC